MQTGGAVQTMTAPLLITGAVLDQDEAADRLRWGKRGFRKWINAHPVDASGVPFYVPNGNRKQFTEDDLQRIIAARREEERCRLSSLRPKKAVRRSTTRGENTSKSLWTEAQRLLRNESPKSRSGDGNDKSSGANILTLANHRPK
jgi:hypothetical protein